MPKKTKIVKRKSKEIIKDCFFCKEKKIPSFLEYEILSRFTSERGKIFARTRSGLCGKHQRQLTNEVKRARYIAFLPFLVKPE